MTEISWLPTVLFGQSVRGPLPKCMLRHLKVNTPMDPEGYIYPIHIVAIRAKDVDLDRKLTILIKNGADIKHKYGSNGLTGNPFFSLKWAAKKTFNFHRLRNHKMLPKYFHQLNSP